MFCRQCGKEIDDDSIFCVHCGIAMAQAVPAQQPVYMVKKRRIWPYALIACIAIVIAVLLLNGSKPGYSSAEAAAEAYVKAWYIKDVEMTVDCSPDFLVRTLAARYGLDKTASRDEVIREIKKTESLSGSTSKKVMILSSQISKRGTTKDYSIFRAANGYFTYLTDDELSRIKEVVTVNITYSVDGNARKSSVICIKMDGRWYVADVD